MTMCDGLTVKNVWVMGRKVLIFEVST